MRSQELSKFALYIVYMNIFGLLIACHDKRQANQARNADQLIHNVNAEFYASDDAVPRRIMSNSAGRVRYALDIIGDVPEVYWQQDILSQVTKLARDSEISAESTVGYFLAGQASEQAVMQLKNQAFQYSHGHESLKKFPFPETYVKYLQMQNQKQACHQDGHSEAQCCKALLLPWTMFDAWQNLSSPEQQALREKAGQQASSFWQTESQGRYQTQSLKGDSADIANAYGQLIEDFSLFSVQNTDAWLMACGAEFNGNFPNLESFKSQHGDYRQWPVTFISTSAAKRVGRRIYRNSSAGISVAETVYVGPKYALSNSLSATGAKDNRLDPKYQDCEIRETEIIKQKKNGTLAFWAFMADGQASPFSVFVDRSMNKETASPAPFTCIGCHYNLNTRLVNKAFPNLAEQGLDFNDTTKPAVRRDATHCQ